MRLRSWMVGGAACASIVAGLAMWSNQVQASDHDDGENDNKARSLNLTDVYAFREDWQTGVTADAANMIVVMNVNPRSVARQQYYFSNNARYELHFTRVADTNVAPTGLEDVVVRYEFGPPASGTQTITATWIEGGTETIGTGTATTTSLANSTDDTALTNNTITVNGNALTVFAGLREDPFFFDVETFFRMRGGEGAAALRTSSEAVDFTAGYNVNSIVTRIPIAAFGADTKFDVWATVSLAMEVEDDS